MVPFCPGFSVLSIKLQLEILSLRWQLICLDINDFII